MKKGFTLLEVLLVLALIFVIVPMTALFYSNYYGTAGTESAARTLALELRKAQLYSMMGKAGMGWGVTLVGTTASGGGTIVLYATTSTYALRTAGYNESSTVAGSVSIMGFNEIDFTKRTGYPNKTSTVTITGSGRSKTLFIQSQGTVSAP